MGLVYGATKAAARTTTGTIVCPLALFFPPRKLKQQRTAFDLGIGEFLLSAGRLLARCERHKPVPLGSSIGVLLHRRMLQSLAVMSFEKCTKISVGYGPR